jgi:predicted amidohydrolase YtcJ
MKAHGFAATALAITTAACSSPEPADLLITNGRVYTLSWSDPDAEGNPAANAPFDQANGWHPDAEAVAIRSGKVVFVGSNAAAETFRRSDTQVLDAQGATVLPGLFDTHVHVANLGAALARVNLVGVKTEAEAIERVIARADSVPAGEWIIGWGWDEGAWANHYPDAKLLSQRVPNHPVFLRGLHTFAGWANQLALDRAGITAKTPAPEGGEIRKGADGKPTGILTNRAIALIDAAIPAPGSAELQSHVLSGLQTMASAGYTEVYEAGARRDLLSAFQALDSAGKLPIRVKLMLDLRDSALARDWLSRGPDTTGFLQVRGVKAFYDGALGSRGALLIADYSDRPGHRGIGGREYGFDEDRAMDMMKAGFQLSIHAIGDDANKGALDFFTRHTQSIITMRTITAAQSIRDQRHRIEHAQVLQLSDIGRFANLGVIASMQPSHAVEDSPWAEQRVGPERIRGAYAWRSLRRAGASLVFSSDLPGTNYDIFYGLHSAVSRRNPDQTPANGWYPNERVSIEEAIRAFTSWSARASFADDAGVIALGRRGDFTLLSIDPFREAANAKRLLDGRIVATIVNGKVVWQKPESSSKPAN